MRPGALIVDLHGVPYLPAVLTGIFVRLMKIVDGMKYAGCMALISVEGGIADYLHIAHLDHWLTIHATEAEALRRIEAGAEPVAGASTCCGLK